MKGIYLMLAAVFITLMISPAAYSTEPSNTSMRYPMKPDVMPYVDYEAANSSDENSSDEESVEWDIPADVEATPGPIGNGTRSPKITEEKKKMLIDLSEWWLMENGSHEYVKKEFEYHGGRRSMDLFQYDYRITCYVTSTLLDRYDFIAEENTTAKNIRIISVRGPSTRDLTAAPPEPIKMVGSLLLNTDEPSEHEKNTTADSNLGMLPNTDEPSEPEEMTTGDLNLGIVTLVLIAFVCIYQRRLYK